ncbi:MAG: PTS transporter subunit EIIC, partial [Bacilli bacterium]
MEYKQVSNEIIKFVGGEKNISGHTHCATRLRLTIEEIGQVDFEKLESMPEIIKVVKKPNEIQIIIGAEVAKLYLYFVEEYEKAGGELQTKVKNEDVEKNVLYYVNVFGSFMSSIFMPMIPALIVGGIILSLQTLFTNYFGLPGDSGTANIMMAIFSAAFTYIPIYIGYNTAKTLKMQPILGALLGAILVSPDISGVEGLSFLGIAIPTVSYGSSVFPVIMGVLFMYPIDKFFNKIIPEVLKYFAKPILTMMVVVPVTLIAIGPLGTYLSGGVASIVLWMVATLGIFALPIYAMIYPYMVVLGLDKAMTPVSVMLIAQYGFNPIDAPGGFISNLCIAGTVLALAFATKNNKADKGLRMTAGITALCGITEPAFY